MFSSYEEKADDKIPAKVPVDQRLQNMAHQEAIERQDNIGQYPNWRGRYSGKHWGNRRHARGNWHHVAMGVHRSIVYAQKCAESRTQMFSDTQRVDATNTKVTGNHRPMSASTWTMATRICSGVSIPSNSTMR